MSEISRLAQAFESNSKSEAKRIEESVNNAFSEHEKALKQALKDAEKRTSDAIHAQNRRLRQIALKGWLWMLLSLVMIGSASAGMLAWTGTQISSNVAEIQRQRSTLAQLTSQGGGVQTTTCGDSRRLCIAMDPSMNRYSTDDSAVYMIPEGY